MSNSIATGVAYADPQFDSIDVTGAASFAGGFDLTGGDVNITTTSDSTNGSTSVEPVSVSTTMTGAGGVGGRAKFLTTINAALGSWSNALKGEVVYGSSGRTTGLGSAVLAEMTLSAGTTSGTYAPLELELNAPTGAKTGTLTSFIHASTQGAAVGEVDDQRRVFQSARRDCWRGPYGGSRYNPWNRLRWCSCTRWQHELLGSPVRC
jgi:hypothetical protein